MPDTRVDLTLLYLINYSVRYPILQFVPSRTPVPPWTVPPRSRSPPPLQTRPPFSTLQRESGGIEIALARQYIVDTNRVTLLLVSSNGRFCETSRG